ncbi:MAG: S8 family serine peptidase [Bacteroidetes bacterium]|nr:S8 family serine peptidase [Bacteroidota bacterium]
MSTSKGGVGRSALTTFSDTSAAVALASKFAGELYHNYPALWPETIRGLLLHSANWTPEMLGNRTIDQLSLEEKIKLLSRVGYGVPNMRQAKHSANNSLSLIAERTLRPYKREGSNIKPNEFHLFDLPWPRAVLQELHATPVILKVTLSYFIEPNPGNRKYELSASYRSCGLRFKMIGPNERLQAFKGRVSKAEREDDYEAEGGENWILGNSVRDKGSIHKDVWHGTAADLATRNKIAVHPVGGWWRTRKGLNRFDNDVRYSLIITIETPPLDDIDIYTPVFNMINIPIPT